MNKRIRYKLNERGNLQADGFVGTSSTWNVYISPSTLEVIIIDTVTKNATSVTHARNLNNAKSIAKQLLQDQGVVFFAESRVSKKQREAMKV